MIIGEKVRLRALEQTDVAACVRWLNDPEVTQFLLIAWPLSSVVEQGWFEKQAARPPSEGQVLAIEALADGQWVHIGNTGLHGVDPIHRHAEFGIFIGDKRFWGKGCGTEATRLMLKHGFEHLNLNRIYLQVFETNLRAQKAYEKAGFKREGLVREGVYKNGRYLNEILMSMLRSEWSG